ncbi:MAG TPA: type II secretion system F family protein [Candidatus Binataceae bacterium]|nr:type II secretion system F family protein [Candidatus Binataceae bacterium]
MSNPMLISALFFCLMGVVAVGIYAALYGSHRVLDERFADLAVRLRMEHRGYSNGELESPGVARSLVDWILRRVPAPSPESAKGEKISQTLVQAGFIKGSALRTFHALRVIGGLSAGVLILIVTVAMGLPTASAIFYAICAGLLGTVVPSFVLSRRARKRQQEIARQISDVLDLLVVCVEAGLGIFEAIKIVGNETERQEQAIGRELALVSGEITAGGTLGMALRNLAERTAVEDIKPLAATLIQSELLGSQMAPALRAISDTLRSRRRMRAEEAAQKTTIKILFPLILLVLPAMIMVIVGPAMIQIARSLSP